MMEGDAPTVLVLEAVKGTLEGIDWSDIPEADGMKTRHARNRHSSDEEKPCTSIEWMGDSVREADAEDVYLTGDEMLMACAINLNFDLDLKPEVSDEDPEPEPEDTDPTGLGLLTKVGMRAIKALKARGSIISQFSDGVSYGGIEADPDGGGDEGRLVMALTVLYRVRTDDPSELLATGV